MINIEEVLKNTISEDETFKFHCTKCGQCCIHREDILLNAKDIYAISKELQLSTNAFINKYCKVYIGNNSGIPVVRLNPIGPNKACPLLKNNKCSVHKVKPSVCAMYPIGRYTKSTANALNPEIKYLYNPICCGDDSEEHTVREWLAKFNIPIQDPFFIRWQGMISKTSFELKEIKEYAIGHSEDNSGQPILQCLISLIMHHLYANYDTSLDFHDQLEKNDKSLSIILEETKRIIETTGSKK